MIKLPNVTIVSINCVAATESVKAINYSRRGIDFKEAILFTHEDISAEGIRVVKIDKLNSVDEYNDFVLKLANYTNSDFVLIVQDDGFVLSPHLWRPHFLSYDYIAAPWPDDKDWIDRQSAKECMTGSWNRVGNGGFSLRSRKFLSFSANFNSCEGLGEDVFLCLKNYNYMISNGIKFAPAHIAIDFSYENALSDWKNNNGSITLDPSKHFGFHGHQLLNSADLINLKNT